MLSYAYTCEMNKLFENRKLKQHLRNQSWHSLPGTKELDNLDLQRILTRRLGKKLGKIFGSCLGSFLHGFARRASSQGIESCGFRARPVPEIQTLARKTTIPPRFVYGECIPCKRILKEEDLITVAHLKSCSFYPWQAI